MQQKIMLKDNLSGAQNFNCNFSYELFADELRFHYIVSDSDIFSPYNNDNDNLFDGDVVEVFISPDGDLKTYYEFEMSPFGCRFFAKITNALDDAPTINAELLPPLFDINSTITENGYNVDIIIAISSMKNFNIDKALFNAFHIDYDNAGEIKTLEALSPTMRPRFHFPQHFIPLKKSIL